MSQVTLEEIKRQCQAQDFSDDDVYLGELQATAEEFVQNYTRRDLDTELPGAWPKTCCHAVKMLVAHWYGQREAVAQGAEATVPFGVRDLLAPHRDLS
ncbi:MAG TPA: phage gp6-like head-tail connector protein [Sulfitobacter sp.]|uniref:head-tail connector protein n=1 Tax=Sulfitobacter dubius TaxID=218673 RepID=UPI000C53F9F0|nr:hypothetical protein [Sulfitobacter sp.]HBB81913.1 phage gp6-like head-tail connector protein [Sulfitobacter sp.]